MSENNLSDIISALSSNKEIVKLAEKAKESGDFGSILSEVASLLGEGESKNDGVNSTSGKDKENEEYTELGTEKNGQDKESNVGEQNTLLGNLLPLFSSSICENSELLIALKPYLSKKRCDLIDSIIKISRLASIVSLSK